MEIDTENKICENCGNPHDGLYGSGRFCSVKCARGFSTKNKDDNLKAVKCSRCNTDIIVFKRHGNNKPLCDSCKRNKKEEKKIVCKTCGKRIKKNKLGYCKDHYKTNPEYHDAISKATKQAFANGTNKGWMKRLKSNPSYPEKFFAKVLRNNNIKYEKEFKVGRFFIDFAILENKIALEIDGKQHDYGDRIFRDQEKTSLLESLGWKVYRIRWKCITKQEGKEYIREEISNFLDFCRNHVLPIGETDITQVS